MRPSAWLALAAVFGFTCAARGQTCVFAPMQEIVPSTGAAAAGFGYRHAVDGDRMVVGAPGEGPTGAAYVYERTGEWWFEVTKLVPSNGSPGDAFGVQVDIKGDRIAVIASGSDLSGTMNRGAVYIYIRQGGAWVQDAVVWPSSAPSLTGPLEEDVSIDGDLMAISAPDFVFSFERQGGVWSELAPLGFDGDGWPNHDLDQGVLAVMRALGKSASYTLAGNTWLHVTDYPQAAGPEPRRIALSKGRAVLTGDQLRVVDALTAMALNATNAACSWAEIDDNRIVAQFGATVEVLAIGTSLTEIVTLQLPAGGPPVRPWIAKDRVLGLGPASGPGGPADSIYSFRNRTFDDLGPGCPGAGGFVPHFDIGPCPAPGSPITVTISGGLGGSSALIFLGVVPGAVPVGAGCSVYAQHMIPSPIVVPLFGAGPGNGAIQFNTSVPAALTTGVLVVQAFVLDAASPIGASATNGVAMSIP